MNESNSMAQHTAVNKPQEGTTRPTLRRLKRSIDAFKDVDPIVGSVVSASAISQDNKRNTSETCAGITRKHVKWCSNALKPARAELWSLPDAQTAVARSLPPHFQLKTVPGDGNCLFHCFREVRPHLSEFMLQDMSGCEPNKWGEEEHLQILSNMLNIRVSVWPVELLKADLLLNEDAALHFGDPTCATQLDLLHWTRDCRGLHFDVLQRPCPNAISESDVIRHSVKGFQGALRQAATSRPSDDHRSSFEPEHRSSTSQCVGKTDEHTSTATEPSMRRGHEAVQPGLHSATGLGNDADFLNDVSDITFEADVSALLDIYVNTCASDRLRLCVDFLHQLPSYWHGWTELDDEAWTRRFKAAVPAVLSLGFTVNCVAAAATRPYLWRSGLF